MNKKISLIASVLLLKLNLASSQDTAWLPLEGISPQALSDSGASLTHVDTLLWPDGQSVLITYWMGGDGTVSRCAERRANGANAPSCWRREDVAASVADSDGRVVRRVSTRPRPLPYLYPYSPAVHPQVWVGVN